MAKINLLLCSRGVSVDKFSNSVSIFEIVETVHSESFPALIPRVWVVAMIEREASDPDILKATLRFRNANRLFQEAPLEFTFVPHSTGSRAIMELPGLPVIEAEDILVELELPNGEVSVFRIRVSSSMPPTIAAPKKPPRKSKVPAKPRATKIKAKPARR